MRRTIRVACCLAWAVLLSGWLPGIIQQFPSPELPPGWKCEKPGFGCDFLDVPGDFGWHQSLAWEMPLLFGGGALSLLLFATGQILEGRLPMQADEMRPVKSIKAPAVIDISVFFRGKLMGSERYYVVELQKNKKSITLITTDGNLRIAKNTLVRIESEDE